jgi:hypothetical protein
MRSTQYQIRIEHRGGLKAVPVRSGLLQRKCACGTSKSGAGDCEQCRGKHIHARRTVTGQAAAPMEVNDVLSSHGQPLDSGTRMFFGSRFGHDFGKVRVHTDARSARSARLVNALAYTVGRDLVFAEGQYAPHSAAGRRLIAHELAHVVQQRNATHQASPGRLMATSAADPAEREADRAADAALGGAPVAPVQPRPVQLARQTDQGDGRPGCGIGPGIPPSDCGAYFANSWWLPLAYVNNATCACQRTPNVATANCVRKFLQDRMRSTSWWLKALAASQKPMELNPLTHPSYIAFVQAALTPGIYRDHVDAYSSCCCPSGPASYPSWIGVTTVPLPCPTVGWAINKFGSCHGTPGTW